MIEVRREDDVLTRLLRLAALEPCNHVLASKVEDDTPALDGGLTPEVEARGAGILPQSLEDGLEREGTFREETSRRLGAEHPDDREPARR